MADEFIGRVIAEKYRIDAQMHEGENLYRATHLSMERNVCIKIVSAADEDTVNSFANEARAVSRIAHPNILSVIDYGTDNGTVFIVYEDITGESLREIIGRVGKLSLKRAIRVIREIESALTVAHKHGIVHQNLNSQNVLVQPLADNSEIIKVLNFGTAAFDINDLDFPVEKAQYLAPEQFSTNKNEVDVRSDVYALGVILYEMLAGEVPLNAPTTTDLIQISRQQTPPPITAFRDDLPPQVDDVLLQALAKNPDVRYQTVSELANELNNISLSAKETEGADTIFIPAVSSAFPTNEIPEPAQPNNNIWKTAFIVLAGIVMLGGSFIYLTSGKQTNPTTEVQTDANGMPVQPVNPATGTTEQSLANMSDFNPNIYSNTNTGMPDGAGGISNPYWETGTLPPGAPRSTGNYPRIYSPSSDPYPVPQQPGIAYPQTNYPPNGMPPVAIDPNSPFTNDGVPNQGVKPSPVPSVSPSPKGKPAASPGVTPTPVPDQTGKPGVSPNPPPANTVANPAPTTDAKPVPSPKGKTGKPTATPKPVTTPATSKEKQPASGKPQDTEKQS